MRAEDPGLRDPPLARTHSARSAREAGKASLAASGRGRAGGREPRRARCSASSGRRRDCSRGGTEVPLEGPVAIVDSISPPTGREPQARRPRHLRGRRVWVARGRRLAGRRRARPSCVPACASSTRSRCIRRSRASSSAGSRETRRSTSARCGCREPRLALAAHRRRVPTCSARPHTRNASCLELVRRRAPSVGRLSPPAACASACDREPVGEPRVSRQQRGRGGTSRARCPSRQPSNPDAPSFPNPYTTRPSGSAPASSRVRPAWFSKPASGCRPPGSSSHSSRTSPIIRTSPATVSCAKSPAPGMNEPSRPR